VHFPHTGNENINKPVTILHISDLSLLVSPTLPSPKWKGYHPSARGRWFVLPADKTVTGGPLSFNL